MSDKPWRVVPRSATDRPDVLEDDHARGCQGREYTCTCGYDERVADEIKRLRDALHAIGWSPEQVEAAMSANQERP
jgi:hypothetical protein